MTRKTGRPKAGQEPLTRERILAAALQLADERGVEALSMRRLARRLGVDPMAIYHHLPGKEAVLAGLVEMVFNELQVPAMENEDWQSRVRAFARAYHRLSRAHPNLVLYLITHAEAGASAALLASERLYAALEAAGLPPEMIIRAADVVVDYLNGFALSEGSSRLGQAGERAELFAQLKQYPPEKLPAMHRVFSHFTENDILSNFETGLDIILAGIAAIAKSVD